MRVSDFFKPERGEKTNVIRINCKKAPSTRISKIKINTHQTNILIAIFNLKKRSEKLVKIRTIKDVVKKKPEQ